MKLVAMRELDGLGNDFLLRRGEQMPVRAGQFPALRGGQQGASEVAQGLPGRLVAARTCSMLMV